MTDLVPQLNNQQADVERLLMLDDKVRLDSDFATVNGTMSMFTAQVLAESTGGDVLIDVEYFLPAPYVGVLKISGGGEIIGQIRSRPYHNETFIEAVTYAYDIQAKYHQAILNYVLSRFIYFWKRDQAIIAQKSRVKIIKLAEAQPVMVSLNTIGEQLRATRKKDEGQLTRWVREQLIDKARPYRDVQNDFLALQGVTTADPKAKRAGRDHFSKIVQRIRKRDADTN